MDYSQKTYMGNTVYWLDNGMAYYLNEVNERQFINLNATSSSPSQPDNTIQDPPGAYNQHTEGSMTLNGYFQKELQTALDATPDLVEMTYMSARSTSPQYPSGPSTSGFVPGPGIFNNEATNWNMNASNSGGYTPQEQMLPSAGSALAPTNSFFGHDLPEGENMFISNYNMAPGNSLPLPAPTPAPAGPSSGLDVPVAGSMPPNGYNNTVANPPLLPANNAAASSSFTLADNEVVSSPSGDDRVIRDALGPNNQDARVQKRGKGKGKSKAKAKAPGARVVRAFSCGQCRKKKTGCDGSPGHPCTRCQKAGTACEIDLKDHRTNKTTMDKCEELRVELNAHLIKVAQVCHHLCGNLQNPAYERGQVVVGAAKVLVLYAAFNKPIESWILHDILRVNEDAARQLPEHRHLLGDICKRAKEMLHVLSKLIEMLTHNNEECRYHAIHMTKALFASNTPLIGPDGLDKKINDVFVANEEDFVYSTLADELNGIIAKHL
ncbi:hypothetical protein BDP81DRAFT_495884 [Colletotrichum phormii]|uniref:Zn(2)-C6 fungal-type domain-containing protein n=1 Tax=Colletotrichum phormii TaxID=359342 RepID=A0AAJ0EDU4_9PEZI|nr:uncharacterized protein BDP81DRAFT_495884 [Colletotrichum phormii]KAK1633446.1 hypothetical protein BDP81DRAFT_495884 [Colletotrichum phormii]